MRDAQPQISRESFGVLVEHQEKHAGRRTGAADMVGDRALSQQEIIGSFDRSWHHARFGNSGEDSGVAAVEAIDAVDEAKIGYPVVRSKNVISGGADVKQGTLIFAKKVKDFFRAVERLF